ncbi:hypothetical protein B0G75_103596 [Paraburkholderia sp. BL18I3N2]|nr:hypothetical protein B0G75_103596 [Paraburkholderia sp. BL18I3N2]
MHERDLGRKGAAQREVGVALMRFSPEVALLDEATVVVEVGAGLCLFGGLLALCRAAKAVLRKLGFSARISAAPTRQSACVLARHENRRVLTLTSLEHRLSALPMVAVPEVRPFFDWFNVLGCGTIAGIGVVCFASSLVLPTVSLRFIALCLGGACIPLLYPCFWSLPPRFFSGARAAGSVAAINCIGNLGGFFGQNLMPHVGKVTNSHLHRCSFRLHAVSSQSAPSLHGLSERIARQRSHQQPYS